MVDINEKLGELMDKRVEVNFNTSPDLREIASILGKKEAEPKDLISIYYKTLKSKLNDNKNDIETSQMYIENGRLMLLELMGYLAQYYRSLALGLSKSIEGGKFLEKLKMDIKEEILEDLKKGEL